MRAVVIHQHGGLDALAYEERETPVPRPDEVLVEVRAVALNHLDLWVRRGVPGVTYPLPLVPGCDVAGVVREAGSRATHVEAGDEVVLQPGVSCGACPACLAGRDHHCRRYGILGEHRDGGCAEFIVVPRENVLAKPAMLSFVEAASIPLTFLTSWHMLVVRAGLRPGEAVLVQGAGSGVGTAAIQIAKLLGATVIAASTSDEKLQHARALGADHVVNVATTPADRVVREVTGKRGAEVVFEHVGAATWESSLRSLAWQGRLVTCGATTGWDIGLDLRHVFFKSLSLLGSTMGSKSEVIEIMRHVEAGRLRPVVDRVLPLAEVREAHRALEARETFGKVVLVP